MSKFLIAGGIIVCGGAIAGLGFEKEWGLWVTIIGVLIALPSIIGY